jgi:hypothetical protein
MSDNRRTILEKAATEAIDWVVVHRIVHEQRACPANSAERLEVVRQWKALGRNVDHLGDFTGWGVWRYARLVADEVAA